MLRRTRARIVRRRTAGIMAAAALAGASLTFVTSPSPAAAHRSGDQLSRAQELVILEATHRFWHIDEALAAGYLPSDDCVPHMGYHYVRPDLLGDVNVDPTLPEILVYVPNPDGSRRLGAIEYFRADADQDKATDSDRPTLFGHRFDGPMDGHAPGMPIHYDLHVWLYMPNPTGQLTMTNPDVACP